MSAGARVAAAVAVRGWRKTLRRPVNLAFSLVQPLFWMAFFGFLMQRYPLSSLPRAVSYVSFLVPGVACMTVMLGASQAGVELIRDMQTGFLQRVLDTPASRPVLLLGKVGADVGRLLAQGLAVVVIGLLLGARLSFAPGPLLAGIAAVALFGFAFSCLSCAVVLRVRSPEGMGTFVHLVNMPLFFTSTALVPHKQMPDWLARVAAGNPLTLAVDALRAALLFGEYPSSWVGLWVPLALAGLLFALATRELGRLAHHRDQGEG
jgi:ABC-2 type transport system permease protein